MPPLIHRVNLLADSLDELARGRRGLRAALLSLALLAAADAALLAGFGGWNSQLRGSTRLLAGSLSGLRAQNDAMRGQYHDLSRRRATQQFAQQVRAANLQWRELTTRLAALLPRDVWIVRLASSTGDDGSSSLSIEGVALTAEAACAFVTELEKLTGGTPALKSMQAASTAGDRTVQFECSVPLPSPETAPGQADDG